MKVKIIEQYGYLVAIAVVLLLLSCNVFAQKTTYGIVESVSPHYTEKTKPVNKCENVPVEVKKPDMQRQMVFTGLGSIGGAIIGSRFGSRSGRMWATSAGTLAGGYAGYKIAEATADKETVQQRQCNMVNEPVQEGWQVNVRVGKEKVTVIRRVKPAIGERIRLQSAYS